MDHVLSVNQVERNILMLRGLKILLDMDLAVLYGVSTKRLNEQIKRNKDRFPSDFMFQLTAAEKREVVANCDHLRNLKFSPMKPFAFTEHGALMAASVLNTPVAVRVSLQVVRAFVRLREILSSHKDLARKLSELEKRYDSQFQAVFSAIRQLMAPPPEKPKRRLGLFKE